MRPIPASRLGDAHGLLRAINERERLRLDEFVTEFTVEELFPPGMENALGRTRQFVSFGRAAGLLNEDRGTVELTEIGKRYVRAADADRPFEVAPAQAEWLRRLLREKHMTDSIFHGAAVALSLCASNPPDFRASTLDFGRAVSHLGRAGWDNENTFQSQGERYSRFLSDMELVDSDRRLTPTGQETRDELTLPIHASLKDLVAELNPGGLDAAIREGQAEAAAAEEAAAPAEEAPEAAPEPVEETPAPVVAEDEYEDVGPGAGPSPAAAPPPSTEMPAVAPAAAATPAPVAAETPPAAAKPTPPADIWDVAAPDDRTRAYPAIPDDAPPPAATPGEAAREPSAGAAAPSPAGDVAGQGGAAPPSAAPGAAPPGAAPPAAASGAAPTGAAPGAAPPAAGPGAAPPGAPASPAPPSAAPPGAAPPGAPASPAPPSAAPPGAPPVQAPPAAPPAATPGEAAGAPAARVGQPGAPPAQAPHVEAARAPTPPGLGGDPLAAAAAAATIASPRPATEAPAFVAASAIGAAAAGLGLRLPASVYAAVAAALAGGHVVLLGPPASGKTTLALAIAKAAAQSGKSDGASVVTAGHRWSARDTIGRPGDEEWQRGVVADAAARGRWLVIDELDRARLDRALGDLSSFLAGVPVTLPDGEAAPPDDWRVVATAGPTGLQGSAALVGRFAHVRVPPPAEADLNAAIDAAAGDPVAAAAVKRLLGARELGRVGAGAFVAAARFAGERNRAEPADERTLAHEALTAHIAPLLADLDDEGRRRLAALAG